jgi:hypothetical protein
VINKKKWHAVENERALIDKSKVKHFINVFKSVVDHYGSIRAAVEKTGIGQSSYYQMINNNILSVCVAHRIMDSFAEIAPYK